MRILVRIFMFFIGILIILFFIKYHIYNWGVLFWFIPILGLLFMGVNIFDVTSTSDSNRNIEVKHNVFSNEDKSNFTNLVNPNNDIELVYNFIKETNAFTSIIFIYQKKKQIVTEASIKDNKLNAYSLIENKYKSFNLDQIKQLKRVNGYHYFWEKHKMKQDFNQIRDYFRKYISVKETDIIRFKGGDNGYYVYSWKLEEEMNSDYYKKETGLKHFNFYLTLSFKDFFLKSQNQQYITDRNLERNYIIAFDFDRNEYRIFYFESVFEYEILYS